jgi:sulfur carrier protein
MQLTVNGRPAFIDTTETLAIPAVLDLLKVEQPLYVTVELNGDVLDRNNFESTFVKEGDALEFLYFMGGGNAAFP